MPDFQTPTFLQNHSVDEIFETMKSILPADIDLSEGGHAWNMTRPTALIAAELCEFVLPEVIKLIFPDWSTGDFVDAHAKTRGMTRRAATAASGELAVTGAAGTIIRAGSLFSTASINDSPSVDYIALETVTIPSTGSAVISVECTQTGVAGNTPANTVILAASKITGLLSVTNPAAITGGTEAESDASLIARINEYDQSQGSSFVGSVADYKRWALSVDGVGAASVLSASDDSGLVTIVLTDANGDPATGELCEAVYDYIMSPSDPFSRLAPVNALLRVEAPETIEISVKATVELKADVPLSAVKAAYLENILSCLTTAMDEGEVKYTRLAAALSAVDGVNDFSGFQIGVVTEETAVYGVENIPLENTQLPVIAADNLLLTEGTV